MRKTITIRTTTDRVIDTHDYLLDLVEQTRAALTMTELAIKAADDTALHEQVMRVEELGDLLRDRARQVLR